MRLPQDRAVNPRPPLPKDVDRRAVGNSPTQNQAMQDDVAYLKAQGAREVRVNQQQINVDRCRVGICRPDVQATLPGGRRLTIEYDTSASTRGPGHATRALSNDPNAIVILRKVN